MTHTQERQHTGQFTADQLDALKHVKLDQHTPSEKASSVEATAAIQEVFDWDAHPEYIRETDLTEEEYNVLQAFRYDRPDQLAKFEEVTSQLFDVEIKGLSEEEQQAFLGACSVMRYILFAPPDISLSPSFTQLLQDPKSVGSVASPYGYEAGVFSEKIIVAATKSGVSHPAFEHMANENKVAAYVKQTSIYREIESIMNPPELTEQQRPLTRDEIWLRQNQVETEVRKKYGLSEQDDLRLHPAARREVVGHHLHLEDETKSEKVTSQQSTNTTDLLRIYLRSSGPSEDEFLKKHGYDAPAGSARYGLNALLRQHLRYMRDKADEASWQGRAFDLDAFMEQPNFLFHDQLADEVAVRLMSVSELFSSDTLWAETPQSVTASIDLADESQINGNLENAHASLGTVSYRNVSHAMPAKLRLLEAASSAVAVPRVGAAIMEIEDPQNIFEGSTPIGFKRIAKGSGKNEFVHDERNDPYVEAAVLLPKEGIDALAQVFASYQGYDSIVSALRQGDVVTVADLEHILKASFEYVPYDGSAQKKNTKIFDDNSLNTLLKSVSPGLGIDDRPRVQCTGANRIMKLSLDMLFGEGHAQIIVGKAVPPYDGDISAIGHAQVVFYDPNTGKKYILDATPAMEGVAGSGVSAEAMQYAGISRFKKFSLRELFKRKSRVNAPILGEPEATPVDTGTSTEPTLNVPEYIPKTEPAISLENVCRDMKELKDTRIEGLLAAWYSKGSKQRPRDFIKTVIDLPANNPARMVLKTASSFAAGNAAESDVARLRTTLHAIRDKKTPAQRELMKQFKSKEDFERFIDPLISIADRMVELMAPLQEQRTRALGGASLRDIEKTE